MKKFWKWRTITNEAEITEGEETQTVPAEENVLVLDGVISSDSWFNDDVTPKDFRDELDQVDGDVTVWINSPGGDVFAAAQIYNMLRDHKGKITVKIDAIAASAATIVAMAGDDVQISPVGMMMIHNPATIAWGDAAEMEKVANTLNEVKETIINAYVTKTKASRNKLAKLMDEETWMNARKAVELGFADSIIERGGVTTSVEDIAPVMFAQRIADAEIVNRISGGKVRIERPQVTDDTEAEKKEPEPEPAKATELMDRLRHIKEEF